MEDKQDFYKMLGLQVLKQTYFRNLSFMLAPLFCNAHYLAVVAAAALGGVGGGGGGDGGGGGGEQELRYRATQQDIRRAYRQCCIKYHPDKIAQKEGQEAAAGQNEDEACASLRNRLFMLIIYRS
jgi:hypothetical protein